MDREIRCVLIKEITLSLTLNKWEQYKYKVYIQWDWDPANYAMREWRRTLYGLSMWLGSSKFLIEAISCTCTIPKWFRHSIHKFTFSNEGTAAWVHNILTVSSDLLYKISLAFINPRPCSALILPLCLDVHSYTKGSICDKICKF